MDIEEEVKKVKKHKTTPMKPDFLLMVEKYNQKQMEELFEAEAKMSNDDKLIKDTYERKNELQSLIYNTR